MTSRSSKVKKPPVHRPLVSPSLTSLLSVFTQTSTGSSGSSSTITQESVSKMRHPTQRRSERKPSGRVKRSSKRDLDHEPSSLTAKGKPNVFAYMEEEDEEDEEEDQSNEAKSRSSIDIPEGPRRTIPPAAPMSPSSTSSPFSFEDMHIPAVRTSSIASLHSDSGISVSGPHSEKSSAIGHKKTLSKSSMTKTAALTRTKSMSSSSSVSSHSVDSDHLDRPESFYTRSSHGPSATSTAPAASQQVQLRTKRRPATAADKNGYDLLSSQLSTLDNESTKPIYRRFESLNNRILLIMQDEIVTMERDLTVIDRQIADIEGPSPRSLRAELRAPTPLQWQRMQICGMLIPKLSQYNRTLASYQSVANMAMTNEDQIKQYKDLLTQHQPLVASETAFLDEITDLVTISAAATSHRDQQKISYELGVALFFLILAFKLIPSILGRMVLGGALVGFLAWSGRLPVDEDAVGGVLGRRVGVYATAVFILSLAVG